MADHCLRGHPTPLAASRDSTGYCRACKRDVNRRNRKRRKELELQNKVALDVVLAFKAAGATFVNGDNPVTPEQLAAQLVELYLADPPMKGE